MNLDVWQAKDLDSDFSDVWQMQGLGAGRKGKVMDSGES